MTDPYTIGDIVIEHRAYSFENAPTQMDYTKYERLVCRYGVALVGWTEPTISQPGLITSSLALIRLVDALRTGECYWSLLDTDDWEARKEAHMQAIRNGEVAARKKRKDAGVSHVLKRKRADLARDGIDEESGSESDGE